MNQNEWEDDRQQTRTPVCWIHEREMIWDGLTWQCPESKRCPAAERMTQEKHARQLRDPEGAGKLQDSGGTR
jgi:hypothetical protein